MYKLKKMIYAVLQHLSSFIMAVLRTAKRNINRAVTFILAVILMTGSFGGYLTPVVAAGDENHFTYPNDTSASSWFAGKTKGTQKKARKAPSRNRYSVH